METVYIDKFHLIEHLGNGHFGNVYLCFDPYLQKEIAIKVIKVPNPQKFVNAVKEGQALDICRHKHIVDVKDVRSAIFEGEAVVIIVMEYLSKGSLQKHIEKRFISCKEACKIVQQCLLGLEHAHNNNILHRDIKPGNIMFGDNGEMKLSDFGLAIDYHLDINDSLGYRPHQPLEVIEGAPMNKLSDLYATGITLYRLLNNTNKLPFTFTCIEDLAKAIRKDKYPPREYLSHIPEKIIKILTKSINNNSTKRYQTCVEFRQALEKVHFYIDWKFARNDLWIGDHGNDEYELSSSKTRKGWNIEFRKNGTKRSEYCRKNVTDNLIHKEFFDIIKVTSLQ